MPRRGANRKEKVQPIRGSAPHDQVQPRRPENHGKSCNPSQHITFRSADRQGIRHGASSKSHSSVRPHPGLKSVRQNTIMGHSRPTSSQLKWPISTLCFSCQVSHVGLDSQGLPDGPGVGAALLRQPADNLRWLEAACCRGRCGSALPAHAGVLVRSNGTSRAAGMPATMHEPNNYCGNSRCAPARPR